MYANESERFATLYIFAAICAICTYDKPCYITAALGWLVKVRANSPVPPPSYSPIEIVAKVDIRDVND